MTYWIPAHSYMGCDEVLNSGLGPDQDQIGPEKFWFPLSPENAFPTFTWWITGIEKVRYEVISESISNKMGIGGNSNKVASVDAAAAATTKSKSHYSESLFDTNKGETNTGPYLFFRVPIFSIEAKFTQIMSIQSAYILCMYVCHTAIRKLVLLTIGMSMMSIIHAQFLQVLVLCFTFGKFKFV